MALGLHAATVSEVYEVAAGAIEQSPTLTALHEVQTSITAAERGGPEGDHLSTLMSNSLVWGVVG